MNLFRDQTSVIIFLLLFTGYQAANYIDNNEVLLDDEKVSTIVDYRLPKTITPLNYQVILIPKLQDDFTFKGVVHINARVEQSTDTITLHHGDIEVAAVTVVNDADKRHSTILKTNLNKPNQKYEIKVSEPFKPGTNITISFDYNGTLRDDMTGFYKSSYVDSTGKIRWLLSTQFQTIHARHAFPCFDEPGFKATFVIRILRPANYTCLSNMPLKDSIKQGDEVWDEFEQSIRMSTYLVAFMVSDFESVEAGNFKVWARPNAVDQARYALDIGTKALKTLSNRFKQGYQISKMDMTAVPDFSGGAMENWGLVTYRESRLLYDNAFTTITTKKKIASVIVHELTHMWFGNQVTPEWWSCLWLSEAFAEYFQYFGTAQIETTWNMDEQFVVEQHQTAYTADSVEASKAMTRVIVNSSQVNSAGDTITYNKGASIVRMMNLIFGSEVFDAVLQQYLKNNANNVGSPQKLWTELQNELNQRNQVLETSVSEIMTTWTEQAGFPAILVIIRDGKMVLRQQRFLLRNLKPSPINETWWIPLTWTTHENPNFNNLTVGHWMSKETEEIKLDKQPTGWVIFNIQSSGFYRVTYDNDSWYRIIDTLNSENYKDIHVLNRAALLDDLLNLARGGSLAYETALDGLKYLTREDNYLPFKAALSGLVYLDQRLSGIDKSYENFKKFVLTLIDNAYKRVGYVDRASDDHYTILLRGELNNLACKYDHKECVETFTRIFQQWKQHKIMIKPNQQPIAYCMGVKHGTKEDWEFLWDHYYNSNYATEQEVLLQALGCTQDAELLERYLSYTLKDFEESRIRAQDSSAVFSSVYGSSMAGAEFVMNFVAKHYAEMIKFYNGTSKISSVLSSASQRFSTKDLVDRYQIMIEERKVEFNDILEPLFDSLKIARYELKWRDRFVTWIDPWVNDFNDEHQTNDDADTIAYRLPTNVIPNSYEIQLTTDLSELDNFTFTGSVIINANVTINTRNIVLHSSGLTHDKISVLVANKDVNVTNIKIEEKYDFLNIEVEKELEVGQVVVINVEFTGHLNEEMRGFYRSSYLDDDGQTRWLAATHMEPVGARKMFPCFDEPAMKAKFTVDITVPQNYSAISNMPAAKVHIYQNQTKTYTFKETPKMSTYLVAVLVSDFSSLKDENEFYGVWARKNAIHDGEYALSVMQPLVDFYTRELGIPYSLPKLDMVALPDFVSGAMENWGLLTYKERNVLFNPNMSTTASVQSIINVIAHEITHQWFGDLVSPQWWKYVWLNEGFARYLQHSGTDSIRKGWSLDSQFVVDHLHSALEADSSASTHAMTHDIYSPAEIREIFDTITYAKAGSVIRMMEKVFGREIFYKALHNYLNERQYDVATPEHLFDAFKELASGEIKNSVHEIMNSWTTQPGYPVVEATIHGNVLELKQRRFFINPQNSEDKSIWHIPITWTDLSNPNNSDVQVKHWFKVAQENVTLPSNGTYLLNIQQAGFYRVNYDVQSWQNIISVLKSNESDTLHEINRATLIDDLLNLGKAGHVDYSIVLSATQYLTNETNYIPWRAFFNGLTYLNKQLESRDGYQAFNRYIVALLTPIYSRLEFNDNQTDSHVTKLFRSQVRSWSCKFNISDCRKDAQLHLNNWINHGTRIPANVQSVSLCWGVENLDKKFRERLWKYYLQSKFSAEKSIILQSFACATEKDALEELLLKAITKDSGIRLEDSKTVFTSVINASPKGVECVINFINNNYNKMVNYYGQVSNVHSIVNTIGKKVFTSEMYVQFIGLLNFLEERKPENQIALKAYADLADHELRWANKNVPKISQWLEVNYPANDYRLPKTFSPTRYNVTLSPYFEERNFTFTGRVQIEMKRTASYVSRIVVNAHKLNVQKVVVHQRSSNSTKLEQINVGGFTLNKKTQTLTIMLNSFVQGDQVILDIDFDGTLGDDAAGFYRSYYTNSRGEIRWLATTQFEATHARQAFPCFDEPAYKATFLINMERPRGYKALSNMPLDSTKPSKNPERVWDTFKETVKMSTYLVAFVVSDFIPVRPGNDVVNIWGRPEIAINGDFAQTIAERALDFLQVETVHKYTLPKLDLIGIPDYTGAMENWGLITFSESNLFYQQNVTSARYTDLIITTIAHEIAHMMYGNLVTCDWWEYLWLNEGFAEYLQWKLADFIRPMFGFRDLFVVDELQPAMLQEDYEPLHPMNNPVSSPKDIEESFDSVTYGKSSSVIRMIERSLGPVTFLRATSQYLSNNEFSTATPKDLWEAFDKEIKDTSTLQGWNISMAVLMDGWTNKKGYPVVSVTKEGDHITLIQKSFPDYRDIQDFWIPITMTDGSKSNFTTTKTNTWLGGYPIRIILERPDQWYILNIQQAGYYRVNYDIDSWRLLIEALKPTNHSMIHVTNRAQIIDDLLNLAKASLVTYDLALNATMYLQYEFEYVPWRAFLNGMSFIQQRYQGQKGQDLVEKYILSLMADHYERLNFSGQILEPHSDQLNRNQILNWACKLEHEHCTNMSVKLFANWRNDNINEISPDARPAVYCTAIKYGTKDDWDFLWQQYLETNFASEKRVILNALGCSKDKQILNSYIQIALSRNYTSPIRKQDVSTVLDSVYSTGKFGVDVILDFLVTDYKRLYNYSSNWDEVNELISDLAPHLSTGEQITKLRKLYSEEGDLANIVKTVNSTIKTANKNLDWYTKNGNTISDWLKIAIPIVLEKNAGTTIAPNTLGMIFMILLTIAYTFSQ